MTRAKHGMGSFKNYIQFNMNRNNCSATRRWDQKNGTWHTNVLRVHSMYEHKKIKPEQRRIAGTQTFLCAWKFLMAWAAEGLSPAAPALSADRCSPAACFAGSCKITILFSRFDDATQEKSTLSLSWSVERLRSRFSRSSVMSLMICSWEEVRTSSPDCTITQCHRTE